MGPCASCDRYLANALQDLGEVAQQISHAVQLVVEPVPDLSAVQAVPLLLLLLQDANGTQRQTAMTNQPVISEHTALALSVFANHKEKLRQICTLHGFVASTP